jgi:hypothetical protein
VGKALKKITKKHHKPVGAKKKSKTCIVFSIACKND